MTTPQSAFAWMFVGLSFVAGTAFGALSVAKDHTVAIFLVFPTILIFLSGAISFTEVFINSK